MSNAEDSGSKCSSGPISSFTIQSILGTPSDAPRSGTKELSKGPPPPPPRRRSLSVSSEEECSGGEDSADCFCSDTGHSEPCTQHQAHNFSCLGEDHYCWNYYYCHYYRKGNEINYLSNRKELKCYFRININLLILFILFIHNVNGMK